MTFHLLSAVNDHFIFTAFDFDCQCGLLILAVNQSKAAVPSFNRNSDLCKTTHH